MAVSANVFWFHVEGVERWTPQFDHFHAMARHPVDSISVGMARNISFFLQVEEQMMESSPAAYLVVAAVDDIASLDQVTCAVVEVLVLVATYQTKNVFLLTVFCNNNKN